MDRRTQALLAWYSAEKRDLPWRQTRDPYAIWVSEVMLQQTQVETVVPYYTGWMQRFPTVSALAQAPIDDVLNAWEGLGYYRRAHGLHNAARQLVEAGRDALPESVVELEALPGIGPYTARAIAAIAFGQDVLALDGNLRRVLARLFDVTLDISTAEGERTLRRLGESLLPDGRADDFNQAMMDLGATVCLARAPRCLACPVREMCAAFEAGAQDARPIRHSMRARPHRQLVQVALRRGGKVMVGRRPADGLLGGMWAFPGVALLDDEAPETAARRGVEEEMGVPLVRIRSLGVVEHAYTHFTVSAHAFSADVGEGGAASKELIDVRWVPVGSLDDLPMGKVDRAIAIRLAGA